MVGVESYHTPRNVRTLKATTHHVSLMSVDLAEPVPDGWDSAAFCSNLLKASNGNMAEAYFPGSRVLILRIKRNYERKRLKGGLQKAFYNALLSTIPPAFENVFARRFKVLEIPRPHIEPFTISRIKHFAFELQSLYSKLPYGVPMIMLRTWSNGWFTTHRTLHEATGGARLPCIYGCGGPDSLVHYLQCEHMWTLICSCTNSPTCSLSTPLAQRICLVNPNRSDISRCVVAFNAYHALRNNHSCDIDKAVSSSDFCDLLLTACEVIQYFSSELMYTNT